MGLDGSQLAVKWPGNDTQNWRAESTQRLVSAKEIEWCAGRDWNPRPQVRNLMFFLRYNWIPGTQAEACCELVAHP